VDLLANKVLTRARRHCQKTVMELVAVHFELPQYYGSFVGCFHKNPFDVTKSGLLQSKDSAVP
jgi:hypothetical protein